MTDLDALDPSRVKAGDTVTLERNRSTVTGPAHIGMPGAISLHLPGSSIWINNSDRADDPVSGGWTLTAHQPAPEPEPEWRGTFVAGRLPMGAEAHGFVDNDGDFFGMEDGFLRINQVENLTHVRPLVVIDPAAARKALEDNGWGEHAVNEILHQTRIEAS